MNKNLFNSIKLTTPKKNVFDLSHDVKLSGNMGDLIPIMCLEAVPGDKFNISNESLIRFAPLVSPVMHQMNVTTHYFFVPNRILWDGWENFITNTKVGGFLPDFPYITITNTHYSKLSDYLGIPTPIGANQERISPLPFAAYQLIYNEYYRDQNLCPLAHYKCADGSNAAPDFLGLRKRAWMHDYFTSALPFAQKGDPVHMPWGTFPDVEVLRNSNPGTTAATTEIDVQNIGAVDPLIITNQETTDPVTDDALYADTSTLNTATNAPLINDLRRAFRLQEWLEKMARGGSRLCEVIKTHFNVNSPDKRLQRPEYITGSKSPVVISEVLNTTGTTDAPQGNMAGHGISVTNSQSGHYYCEEHGYILGIMSITPVTAYQQGIPKHFLKRGNTDFFWPAFANIGEQEVQNKEIYAFQAGTSGEDVFGYTPRYAEYKYSPSRVAGDFRTSLDFWHLGRIFSTPPSLNQDFIECTPTHRIFAVTDPAVEKLYCHVFNKVRAVRPMPKFGTPTF